MLAAYLPMLPIFLLALFRIGAAIKNMLSILCAELQHCTGTFYLSVPGTSAIHQPYCVHAYIITFIITFNSTRGILIKMLIFTCFHHPSDFLFGLDFAHLSAH
jgi:hypothetical protein